MERTYRISLTLERTFKRKARQSVSNVESYASLLLSERFPDWEVRSSARQVKKSPRKKQTRDEPDDRPALLDEARGIAEKMHAILKNAKRPKLHWHQNRWCKDYVPRAHSHCRPGARHRGLICLNPSHVRRCKAGGRPAGGGLVELIAHELTHLRLPTASHHRKQFKEREQELVRKFMEMSR